MMIIIIIVNVVIIIIIIIIAEHLGLYVIRKHDHMKNYYI